jgi:hypothetical protein
MAEVGRRGDLRRRWEAELAEDRVPADWTQPVPEASYPVDEHGGQDLANFDKPIDHYIRYHEDYLLYLEVLGDHLEYVLTDVPQDVYARHTGAGRTATPCTTGACWPIGE